MRVTNIHFTLSPAHVQCNKVQVQQDGGGSICGNSNSQANEFVGSLLLAVIQKDRSGF